MLVSTKLRRWAGLAAVVALTATTGACSDDPTGEEREPEIAFARISVGGQSVTINDAGTQTGTLTVPRGQSTVTVAYFRDNNQPEDLVTSAEFEVRLLARTGTSGVTFTPSGAFGGTLNTTTAGAKSLDVQLFHKEEGHADFNTILTLTSQ
jgi:hypothetical protein